MRIKTKMIRCDVCGNEIANNEVVKAPRMIVVAKDPHDGWQKFDVCEWCKLEIRDSIWKKRKIIK